MSSGLVRKVLGCADSDYEEDDGATPTIVLKAPPATAAQNGAAVGAAHPPMPLEREVPSMVRHFVTLLDEQGRMPETQLGVVWADAHFEIDEAAVRRGMARFDQPMDVAISGALRHKLAVDRRLHGLAPHALSVVLASYDTRPMPFDMQLSIGGMRLSAEPRLGERRDSDACLRDYVLPRSAERPRGGDDEPIALLTRPLVCEESLTDTRFGSIEAIGFDSADLFERVVQLVDRETDPRRCERLALLFGARQGSLGALGALFGGDAQSAAAHHSTPRRRRFCLLPIGYEFTSLLVRVHIYLTMRALRHSRVHEVPRDAIDRSLYELPYSSELLVFPHDELHEVVDFINRNLVDVHPQFDPFRITAHLAPFDQASWTKAWSDAKPSAPPAPNGTLRCSVKLIVFYALLPQPALKRRAAPTHGANGMLNSYYQTVEKRVDRMLAAPSSTDDDDGSSDDDGYVRAPVPPADFESMVSESYDASRSALPELPCKSVRSDDDDDDDDEGEYDEDAGYDHGNLSAQQTPPQAAAGVHALPLNPATPRDSPAAQSSPATFSWPAEALERMESARATQSATSSADGDDDDATPLPTPPKLDTRSPLTPGRFAPCLPGSFTRHAAYSADTVVDSGTSSLRTDTPSQLAVIANSTPATTASVSMEIGDDDTTELDAAPSSSTGSARQASGGGGGTASEVFRFED